MKTIFLLIAAVLTAFALAAQPPKPEGASNKKGGSAEKREEQRDSLAIQRHRARQEKVQVRKAAYFTTKLELTTDEAQAFWPVYNEFWQKRDRLFTERQNLLKKIQSSDVFDDKKAQQVTRRLITIAQEEADLLREYSDKFTKVLPPKKLLKYYAAEEEFKLELINDLRKQEKGKKR